MDKEERDEDKRLLDNNGCSTDCRGVTDTDREVLCRGDHPCVTSRQGFPSFEVLNPEGVVQIEPTVQLNPHPSTLEGKTIMLRWNGKHNGDRFLNRIGELLVKEVKGVKIIRSWEVAPETVEPITGSQERSMELMKKLAAYKPDLVIGSQAD